MATSMGVYLQNGNDSDGDSDDHADVHLGCHLSPVVAVVVSVVLLWVVQHVVIISSRLVISQGLTVSEMKGEERCCEVIQHSAI